ncbi:MAG: prolipoprotein diacylglyceryl transferase [Tyzzerella sp.]|uniref:Phosphatidylglycerol--prolipoprotein diacylglyceryl transferase n=1 Tax=Candidatus Fimicola merdigallinarum TaxID=2840819 RepID=A0A9D9H298_9FIRM|nr:prolipoprotein diacylglyceryl transferase [Candidatus Fimicola merdigallinarum]
MGEMPEIWFPNLGIKIKELNNVAFTVFGLNVYWYGVIIGLGIIISLALAVKEAKRTGQNPDNYMDFTMIAIVICVICARLYYVIFSWDYYSQHLNEIFATRNGGLAIYGGIIGGIATAIVYTKVKKLNFWLFADTTAPSLLLGQIIGRWGNFFNREAFGGYTDGLFAMRYMKEQVSNIPQSVLDNIINVNGVQYIQVQPTFLYESLWNLGVFVILMILKRRKKFDGEIFGFYLLGYGLGRVWIEGLRTDQLILGNTGIPVSQLLSAIIIIISIVILYIRYKKIGNLYKNDN